MIVPVDRDVDEAQHEAEEDGGEPAEAGRRPRGQVKPREASHPTFGPSGKLDYELEIGAWIGGGNELGQAVAIGEAVRHVAGLCLLNDLSARDIQAWEYQPLGPFLAKSFATVVSPWIVTAEALAPFRVAQTQRPAGDPPPLPHLWDEEDQEHGGFAVELEAVLSSTRSREAGVAATRVCETHTRHMYWTFGQMVAHHTSNGCNLRPGDLLGSGTISSPDPGGSGSLLEATMDGRAPVTITPSEERRYLEDGDEVVLRATCRRDGYATIGFGDCRAMVASAAP